MFLDFEPILQKVLRWIENDLQATGFQPGEIRQGRNLMVVLRFRRNDLGVTVIASFDGVVILDASFVLLDSETLERDDAIWAGASVRTTVSRLARELLGRYEEPVSGSTDTPDEERAFLEDVYRYLSRTLVPLLPLQNEVREHLLRRLEAGCRPFD